jgi:hypothetical protein
MEHSEEDEGPFDLSKDGPPALHVGVSKTCEKARRGHTAIIHGARI